MQVTESLIEKICTMGQGLVGDRHPSADLLKERWKHNKGVIQAIAPINSHTAVAGYFILYPLKRGACVALDEGRVDSARKLQHRQHFCKTFRTASGIYISMVWGNAEIAGAQAYILNLLLRSIQQSQGGGRPLYVYARPFTAAGHHLMHRYKFQEINAQSGLWKLSIARKD